VTAIVPLRFALYLDLMILFGVPLHGMTIAGYKGARRSWTVILALGGAALSVVAFLTMVAVMAGQPIASLDVALVRDIVGGSTIGTAFEVRTAALLVAAAIGAMPRIPPTLRRTATTIAGGTALASLAWTGHGAMDDGAAGWLHLVADIAHLLAAGLWIGALASLLMPVIGRARRTGNAALAVAALHGFGRVGTAVVVTLLVTGAINIWAMLLRPGVPLFPLTTYTRLLLLKLAAFVAMLALAALNRWLLVPRFARGRPGIATSLSIETGLGIAVLAIMAVLGTLAPAGG
jgi:putative copper resistance protein D